MRLQQICFGYSRLACSPSMLHIQDRQSNQRAAKRLSEPCNIYRRAGYNGVFEPHLGNNVCRDSNGLNDHNEGVGRRESHIQLCFPISTEVMYRSVDNSRNDCINENKELDNQEQHKLHCGKRPDCFGTKYTGSCHVPTQSYICDRIDAGELKGWSRGWSNLDSFRPE